MKTIKLTDKEHEIVSKILGNLSEQIDEEITNLVPADVSDEEADQILDEARDAFAKIF
jgi:predicted metal-binding transcription factor (methanogenesis marker protein 9)